MVKTFGSSSAPPGHAGADGHQPSSTNQSDDRQGQRWGRGLGWFSLGLGVPQLVAPGLVNRFIGVNDSAGNNWLMRLVGVRELGAAAGLLTPPKPPPGWLWARVAGDAMDLSLLGAALGNRQNRRSRVALATVAVLGVGVLDVISALQRTRAEGRAADFGRLDLKAAITVKYPPEDVYRYWHNFENLANFMTHLEAVESTGNGRSRWIATGPAGSNVSWEAEVVEDRPNELIAWRSVNGAQVYTRGVVRFAPAPGGRGTEVIVEMEYQPPAGALGAAVAKLFGEEPQQQVKDDLRRFKQVLETGEVVRSEGSPDGARTTTLLRQRPAQPLP
jgi:uncharacterized membrane protein